VAYSGTEFKAETKSEGGRARLYVYRHVAYVGIANADVTFLHLDGQRIGRIRMGGFISVPISPGQHSLKTTESILGGDTGRLFGETSFSATPGSNVYFRYSEGFKTFIPIVIHGIATAESTGDYRFESVSEAEALAELKGMKQIELERKGR
jgi:hypothetical protein